MKTGDKVTIVLETPDGNEEKKSFVKAIEGGKIIGWLIYHDFMSPPVWLAYKAYPYKEGEEINGGLVFQGTIPDNSFGKELIKNIFHTT